MRHHVIRDATSIRPFVPFVMYMTNDKKFEIRHPELLSVTKDSIYFYPDAATILNVVDVLHVQQIEFLGDLPKGLPSSYKPRNRDDMDDFPEE